MLREQCWSLLRVDWAFLANWKLKYSISLVVFSQTCTPSTCNHNFLFDIFIQIETYYLILESTKRALDKKAFDQSDDEKRCPINVEKIETYLQILKPLYLLNISLQSNYSTIGDVLPGKYIKSIL